MTIYFTAPDGHGDETLWADSGDPDFPQPIIRRRDIDFPGMAHHWDEIVARVIAGNPDAQEMSWREALRNPQDHDIEWGTPVDRRLAHIQDRIIANAVTEAEFRGRLDRAVGEAWAAGYREAEYERNRAE